MVTLRLIYNNKFFESRLLLGGKPPFRNYVIVLIFV